MNVRAVAAVCTAILIYAGLPGPARAENWKQLADLRGKWKFEIGDDMHRAEPGFNDAGWESIYAPSAWEDQGFPGYDGYAWYRKHFQSSPDWKDKTLALHMGTIDDVDEVYLNGRLVGATGSFPPGYRTAYDVNRIYTFPFEYLNPSGDNVVAVRVYDYELSGGITRGRIGVYEDLDALRLDLTISSGWKFSTGDDPEWKDPRFDDSNWKNIIVPEYWESQGYPDYDGFAWYRLRMNVPADLVKYRLILLLGKIDDFDETYLNGEKVGRTGNMATRVQDIPGSDAYQQLRAYTIPPGLIHTDRPNVIAVRVYDGFKDGGIYAGPIGIVTREAYLQWQSKNSPPKNFFDWLFR